MKKKNLFKRCIFITCFAIVILFAVLTMLRYEVEGEKTLPYKLSKILIISTVEGNKIDDGQNLWNISLNQANDFYIYLDPEKEEETQTIKSITFDNFVITKSDLGEAKIYRPTGDLNNLYSLSKQNYIGNKIVYLGDKIDDLKSLQLSNNGGVAGFRLALENIGNYVSNDDTEIVYNGSLLNKVGITNDKIKMNLSFDIAIQTNNNVTYKGNINVDTPAGDLTTEGSSNTEITNFDNVVFKRVKTN